MNARKSLIVVSTSLVLLLLSLSFAVTSRSAPPQKRRAVLTAKVTDEGGGLVIGAHVAVFQGEQHLGAQDTDARGIAQIEISLNAESPVELVLEVSKRDMQTKPHKMKLGTSFPLRLPLEEIVLKGGAARADTILSIKVVDNARREVSGALVEIDQGPVPIGHANTNSDGVAQIQISAKPNEPLSVRASKAGLQPGASTINLGANVPQHFPQQQIVLEPGIARDIFLAVQVMDEKGAPIPTARVNVYVGMRTGNWVVRAPDFQEDTGATGLVRFTIPMRVGAAPSVTYEVSREDKETIRASIDTGPNSPSRLPIEKVVLKSRFGGEDGTSTANIRVQVTDDRGNPLEGALVSSQPPGTGITKKQQGVTGTDGYAILSMPLWSADNYEKFTLEVSKPGYKDNKGGIEIDNRNKYNRANGKTFDAKPISLLKLVGDISVKITVLDGDTNNGVPGAEVILDGPQYATGTTNTSGVAPLAVDKPGTYKVRISQDTYWPVKDAEIHIVAGRPPNPEPIRLRPKPTKDAAEDSIDITVLAKDSIDDKEPHPLKGAAVSDGRGTQYTDERGQVNLRGAFDRAQDITVSANDYKPVTRRVTVAKGSLLGNATGKATFVLDPALSNDTPIRLVVEVFDASTETKIDNAYVYAYFLDKGKEIQLATSKTENGEAKFTLKGSDNLPLSKLRSGLRIYGKAVGYLLSPSDITDLTVPSLEAKRLTIFLKHDWDALTKQIEALETKVNAWKFVKGPDPAEMQRFINKANLLRQEAQDLFKEIEAAAKRFPELTTFGSQTICSRSGKLLLDIRTYESQVNQKADEFEKTLKESTDKAARCSSMAEAESLRASSRKAIQLVAEIGALRKKAVEDHNDLELVAAKSGAAPQLLSEMKAKADQLTTVADAAGLNDLQAAAYHKRKAVDSSEPVALIQELEKLTAEVNQKPGVPPELLNRMRVMTQLLRTPRATGQSAPPATITSARADITALQARAVAIISGLGSVCSNFPTLDDVVERIDTRNYTISTFGIGQVAELAKLADACVARAAKGPGPKTGSATTADNTADQTSTSTDPNKDNKPATAGADPPIKIGKPGKPDPPGTQDTSSGGFWDAAKAGKKDVENSIGNKPAKPTKPAPTGETSDTWGNTNTVTNKSGNKPTNPLSNTDEKSADKPNTVTSKSGNNQTDSSSVPADRRGTNTTGNKTSNQTKPAAGTEESANSTTNKTTSKTNNPSITVEEIPEERVRPSTAANKPTNRQGNSSAEEISKGVVNKPTAGGGKVVSGGSGTGKRGAGSPQTNRPPVSNGGVADGRPICERLPQEIRAQFAPPSGKLLPISQGIAGGPACRGDLNAGQPQYLSFYVERAAQPGPRELVQPALAHGGTAVAGLGELSAEEDYRGERIVYIIRVARGPYYLSVEGLPQSKIRLRDLAQQLDAALKSWSRPR